MKVFVQLRRMVPQTVVVTVETDEKRRDLRKRLGEVYDQSEGAEWEEDVMGCEPEEGEHDIIENAPESASVDVTLWSDEKLEREAATAAS